MIGCRGGGIGMGWEVQLGAKGGDMGRPLYTTVLNLNNPSQGGKSTTFFYNLFNQVTKAIFIKLGLN